MISNTGQPMSRVTYVIVTVLAAGLFEVVADLLAWSGWARLAAACVGAGFLGWRARRDDRWTERQVQGMREAARRLPPIARAVDRRDSPDWPVQ